MPSPENSSAQNEPLKPEPLLPAAPETRPAKPPSDRARSLSLQETQYFDHAPNPQLPLSAQQQQSLQAAQHLLNPIEARYVGAPDEYLHLFDDAGQPLLQRPKRGQGNVIDVDKALSPQEKALAKDQNVSHNHLKGKAPSPEDIYAAVSLDAKSLKAFGLSPVDGRLYVYILKRVGTDWKMKANSPYNNPQNDLAENVWLLGEAMRDAAKQKYNPLVAFKQVPGFIADFRASWEIAYGMLEHLDALLEVHAL